MVNTAKRKGTRNENKAAKELDRHLISLSVVRVPGSGAFAHRGEFVDPAFAGDLQVRSSNHRNVEYIEVKVRDPQSNAITIAQMDRWREGRRIVMARQDRGLWLCSLWCSVWDELCGKAGEEPFVTALDEPTRGVKITEIQHNAMVHGGGWIVWGDAAYGTVRQLGELLEAAHGEPAQLQALEGE